MGYRFALIALVAARLKAPVCKTGERFAPCQFESGRVLHSGHRAVFDDARGQSAYQRHPGELRSASIEGHRFSAARSGRCTLDETVSEIRTARAECAQRL